MGDSIHDDHDTHPAPAHDSSISTAHGGDPGVLKIYQTGKLTVVGFGGEDVPDEVCIAGYRDQLHKLLDDHQCQVLAFDLSGVKLVPSGMLGVLTTLRKRVQRLEIYNASENVREVLKITNLIKLFDLRDVEVDGAT
jgi:anti-sigma B factor antagonist